MLCINIQMLCCASQILLFRTETSTSLAAWSVACRWIIVESVPRNCPCSRRTATSKPTLHPWRQPILWSNTWSMLGYEFPATSVSTGDNCDGHHSSSLGIGSCFKFICFPHWPIRCSSQSTPQKKPSRRISEFVSWQTWPVTTCNSEWNDR